MAPFDSYKIQIYKPPEVKSYTDLPSANTQYEEIKYDYQTGSYKTLSQEREINTLKRELLDIKVKRNNSLKNIIGYFYSRSIKIK